MLLGLKPQDFRLWSISGDFMTSFQPQGRGGAGEQHRSSHLQTTREKLPWPRQRVF